MNKDNGIRYKQVIDLGFKRKDLGGDQVFHDQHGYDWFIASKTLVKEQGCKIIANWHPETQEIEVLYLNKKRDVISRQRFSGQHGLARYRAIQLFFKPRPQSIQYRPFVLASPGTSTWEQETEAPVYQEMSEEQLSERRRERVTTPKS